MSSLDYQNLQKTALEMDHAQVKIRHPVDAVFQINGKVVVQFCFEKQNWLFFVLPTIMKRYEKLATRLHSNILHTARQ